MPFAIEIDQLVKHYRGALSPALDGLSARIKKGSITGLLGPNGAGKTTTINILCGLIRSDDGTAMLHGYNCKTESVAIRRVIGMVPQQIALFSQLSALENFLYVGRLYGIPDPKIRERSMHLLERLGLEKHADKRIVRYSGGMKRRANIIASLLHEPEVLILDEPTAGVDVQSRAMILTFLQEYNQSGKTILYTSHLLDEAEQLCDEVMIIDEGRNVLSGSPAELIADSSDCQRLEDVFLKHTGHSIRDYA